MGVRQPKSKRPKPSSDTARPCAAAFDALPLKTASPPTSAGDQHGFAPSTPDCQQPENQATGGSSPHTGDSNSGNDTGSSSSGRDRGCSSDMCFSFHPGPRPQAERHTTSPSLAAAVMPPSVLISPPPASLEVVPMVSESPPLAGQPGRRTARDACALPVVSPVAAAQTSSASTGAATESTSAAAGSSAAAVALPAVVHFDPAATAAMSGRAESCGESGAAHSARSNSNCTAGAVSAAGTDVGGRTSVPRKRSLVSAAVQVHFLPAHHLCDLMLPVFPSLSLLPSPVGY